MNKKSNEWFHRHESAPQEKAIPPTQNVKDEVKMAQYQYLLLSEFGTTKGRVLVYVDTIEHITESYSGSTTARKFRCSDIFLRDKTRVIRVVHTVDEISELIQGSKVI